MSPECLLVEYVMRDSRGIDAGNDRCSLFRHWYSNEPDLYFVSELPQGFHQFMVKTYKYSPRRPPGRCHRAGQSRTASAESAATVAMAHRPGQPAWASTRPPSQAPLAIPMNMPVNSTALSRLRAAGSMP
jgi:hypothetical protein